MLDKKSVKFKFKVCPSINYNLSHSFYKPDKDCQKKNLRKRKHETKNNQPHRQMVSKDRGSPKTTPKTIP
jgi:hypothetical protein